MTRSILYTALCAGLSLAPCGFATRAAEAQSAQPSGSAKALSDAYNDFGFKLFHEIAKADSGSNIFISPASAAMALAMLYNGAAGTTQSEMAGALVLGDLSLEEVNSANTSLLSSLGMGDSSVQLAVANSIWYRNTFQFRQDFLERTRRVFSAGVEALDFDAPGTPGLINGWVKERTHDKISKMVEQIGPDDVMFLMNAVYFKGLWTHPFSKEHTSDRTFHCLDGSTVEVPMMEQTEEFGYLAIENFQAIRLPYGKGSCSMFLFLPFEDYELQRFVAELTPENWTHWRTQLAPQRVHIVMPRFKMDYDRMLNDPLMALGMKSAFDPGLADLSGLWDRPKIGSVNLFVSFVRQKTFVDVNEEGTEAAAATGIGIMATSVPPPPPDMIVDRPFFCAIVDNTTGLILFMGAIVDPAKAGPAE